MKYEITNETIDYGFKKLHRIRALKDFGDVKKGDLGGYVETMDNLSQEGDCWIYDNGKVMDYGFVSDKGKVFDNGTVSGNGVVLDKGEVCDNGSVRDNGEVSGYGKISGNGEVYGNGAVRYFGSVLHNGKVLGDAVIDGYAKISGNSVITGDAVVKSIKDYVVFKNTWSTSENFTWTKSNNMWSVGCFYGTGEELIKKAYEESVESGKRYESYVRFVKENFM